MLRGPAGTVAGARVLWLQTGVVSAEAEQIATEGGLTVVMDRCTGAMHGALGPGALRRTD